MPRRLFILLPFVCMLIACQPVRDAQQTVALADSLRVNEGVTCDDSIALANAYATLGHWRLIYPNAYARACYYYGRMLRNRNDQVSAMRAFINGTHAPYIQRVVPVPWFNDYHILGRIYSNMGTMCHEDDEFQLSYDMYELSASCFLEAKDSLRFYHGELSKIFEIISLQKYDSALTMLDGIASVSQDSHIVALINLMRGYAYRSKAQYDTGIYYANRVPTTYHDPAFLILKAQCFASLEQYDSAVLYAKQVMEHPSSPIQNKYNAAYIIVHEDSTISEYEKDSLIDLRYDIGVLRREEMSALSHSIEILLLDRQSIPSRTKISLFVIALIALSIIVFMAAWYAKIRLHRLRLEASQKLELLEEYQKRQSKRLQELEKECLRLRTSNDLKRELHWNDYEDMCKRVDDIFDNFTHFLLHDYPLNETETRLCVLVVIDIPLKQIAKMLPCAESSVKTTKRRTAQKLHTNGKDLRKCLLNYIVGDL